MPNNNETVAENNTERNNFKLALLITTHSLALVIADLAVKYSALSIKPDSPLNNKENSFSIAVNSSIALSAGLCSIGHLLKHANTPLQSGDFSNRNDSWQQKALNIGQNPTLNTLSFFIASSKFIIPAVFPNATISEVDSPITRMLNGLTAYYLTPKTTALLALTAERTKNTLSRSNDNQTDNDNIGNIDNISGQPTQNNTASNKDYLVLSDNILLTLLLGAAVAKFAVQSVLPGSKNSGMDFAIATTSSLITLRNIYNNSKKAVNFVKKTCCNPHSEITVQSV